MSRTRDGRSGGNARHTDIHLVHTIEFWGFAKIQDLSHPVSDGNLRSNSTPGNETCAVYFQHFPSNGGVARRGDLRGPCVKDRALS